MLPCPDWRWFGWVVFHVCLSVRVMSFVMTGLSHGCLFGLSGPIGLMCFCLVCRLRRARWLFYGLLWWLRAGFLTHAKKWV